LRRNRAVSFLGSASSRRRIGAALLRQRVIAATAGTAAAVMVAGFAFAASAHGSSQEKLVNAGDVQRAGKPARSASPSASPTPAGPLRLLSASPAGGTRQANGGAPITLTFSSALAPGTPLPAISPRIAGRWQVSGATATFTPASGFLPGTRVTVSVPGGGHGMTAAAASAGTLAKSAAVSFTTGSYSTLGLQVLLAQLGYLPLTWIPAVDQSALDIPGSAPAADGTGSATASMNAVVSAAYDPPAGAFTFQSGYPASLTSQWRAGKENILDDGAIRAFENNQGMTMDGIAGPAVWAQLLSAAAKNETNPDGYSYALASQNSPHESLKVWHNGTLILNTAANTGVAGASTADGTFPVYERLQFQIMKGTNLDGTKYADPVYWISYFNGGDAVHYFDRPGYGYYQSLGCVELPWQAAKYIWSYLTYGTLVTVTGPVP
jgi:peptidoglycan hydrolase-like protein with peptidoglycan-binding domain